MLYKDFKSYGSLAAYGAGISWFLYTVSFMILKNPLWSSLFLMLAAVFALAVFVTIYRDLKEVDSSFAIYILLLGFLGSFGALTHGGYDLANIINPPAGMNANLPSQIDPRGLLTFGVTGAAILKLSWLMQKIKAMPVNLAYLGILSGILLIIIYLGRLIVLDPTNPLLRYPILIEGFIVNPLWYLWLGSALSKKS